MKIAEEHTAVGGDVLWWLGIFGVQWETITRLYYTYKLTMRDGSVDDFFNNLTAIRDAGFEIDSAAFDQVHHKHIFVFHKGV